ncbi:MAG TPA: hypothetical protein VGO29_00780 [Solirubrobacteraceae bacterium]|jgi:hypothetical protein|nr:hypothetical protein [Solirubrobacteraceae bacterium]
MADSTDTPETDAIFEAIKANAKQSEDAAKRGRPDLALSSAIAVRELAQALNLLSIRAHADTE